MIVDSEIHFLVCFKQRNGTLKVGLLCKSGKKEENQFFFSKTYHEKTDARGPNNHLEAQKKWKQREAEVKYLNRIQKISGKEKGTELDGNT